MENLWGHMKDDVAANRVYPELDKLANHATTYLDHLSPTDRRRLAALHSSKYLWIPT